MTQLGLEEEEYPEAEQHWSFGPTTVPDGGTAPLPGLKGDALEVLATFSVPPGGLPANSSFGVALRVGGGNAAADFAVGYRPSTRTIGVGKLQSASSAVLSWGSDLTPQPSGPGTVQLRIFLDRSVLTVATYDALTSIN